MTFLSCHAQAPAVKPACSNPNFEKKVSNILSFTVPLKSVDELSKEKSDQYLILDTREKEEFDVSHIKNAQYVGYNKFDINSLSEINKDQPIIVYCSIGYRSEKIGEKLQKAGFKNVYNLYGSIFEWVNQGNEVITSQDQTTNHIHTYNKNWSKWVFNKKYKKVW